MWNRLCGNAVCSYGAGDTGGLLLFNATSASETLLLLKILLPMWNRLCSKAKLQFIM